MKRTILSISIIIISCLLSNNNSYSQPLTVVNHVNKYKHSIRVDSTYKMVELHTLMPNVIYDLRYATVNNFTHQQLYKSGTKTFLRLPVAYALLHIQKELNKNGYGLKIFDAYRPYSVTKRMWKLIHDERYVANPSKGSGHNRGLAVDVTIINLRTGKELDMGTGFDNFTDTAHHSFTNLSATILQNRELLKKTMQQYGFKLLETEWWHYSWPNDKNYEVMNLSFKQLEKLTH